MNEKPVETMKVELTAEEAQRVINSQRREIGELKTRLRKAWTHTHYMDGVHYFGGYMSPKMIDGAIKHLRELLHLAECGNPDYDSDELEKGIKMYEDMKKEKDYNEYRGLRVSFNDFRYLYVAMDYDERAARAASERLNSLRTFLVKDGEETPPTHWFSGPGNRSWMP